MEIPKDVAKPFLTKPLVPLLAKYSFPEKLAKRILNLRNVLQRPDFHPEGNVYVHTKIVVNRLLRLKDINLILSAIFHDIGKDSTAIYNEAKGFFQHPGHEVVSAKVVEAHKDFIESCGADFEKVHEIVAMHTRFAQMVDGKITKKGKIEALMNLSTARELIIFSRADDMLREFDVEKDFIVDLNNLGF